MSKNMPDDLGTRMKENYENRYRFYLTRRTPVILRLDGVAFHTFTKKMTKPFDQNFIDVMADTAYYLTREIQGAVLAYVQSDEISLVLHDYKRITTDAWFDYNLAKVTSVAASLCSVAFCKNLVLHGCFDSATVWHDLPHFDCRAFNIPESEVVNYLVWRQKDCTRNSVLSLGQSIFSHKKLQGCNAKTIKEMLVKEGHPWESLDSQLRLGTFIIGNEICTTLVAQQYRNEIEDLLKPTE